MLAGVKGQWRFSRRSTNLIRISELGKSDHPRDDGGRGNCRPGRGKWVGGSPKRRGCGSRLTQIDLGVVADVEAAGFAFDLGVAANEGMGQHNVVEVGK